MSETLDEILRAELEKAAATDERAKLLLDILHAKYELVLTYALYGDALQAYFRDGVHAHFQEHLREERALAYEATKKLVALGRDPTIGRISPDEVPLDEPRRVFEKLLDLERASVALYQRLFDATRDDAAFNALAQEGALRDQQHADDMARYLRTNP